ncbi:thiol:disulfide interchange protein DsbA [Cricetibacter osteomyelitidis]|uniref:Thiol:disulfide interchange protein n=1 Tax=Cricetibacter osteomyelitidis TaxID=1521931 RepID=A0A4R2T4I5_9PAST|nr:DsbA family protein [Cricetibacter osteomyelitidis]TCP96236.1 thiol:disulfide interchange protein DsbA [Cricetibacter osteomyelitidis]
MKKFLLILTALFAATTVQAAPTEGKEYTTLDQPKSAQPEVIEFFSFGCIHCYHFETQYKIPQQIKEKLPAGVSFKQYHVNWMGDDFVRAWALAMALGVEDKVKMPLFEGVQARKISSMDDIRDVFLANGVSAEQFDGGINSFAVNALFNQQVQLAEKLKVQATPDFYVNGKYHINAQGMPQDESFIPTYVDTVIELLKK